MSSPVAVGKETERVRVRDGDRESVPLQSIRKAREEDLSRAEEEVWKTVDGWVGGSSGGVW